MALRNINFLTGNIEYDAFNIDLQLPYDRQKCKLDSNLLFVSYENGRFVIDIGWEPPNDPHGKYKLKLVSNSNWNEPTWIKYTNNNQEMELYLQAFVYIIDNFIHNNQNPIVFEKKDKRRLFWLVELYLSNKIDLNTFCREFHECYNLEVDFDSFTPLEEKAFSELAEIEGRFSEFIEDHLKYPGAHYTQADLKAQIIKTKSLFFTNDEYSSAQSKTITNN